MVIIFPPVPEGRGLQKAMAGAWTVQGRSSLDRRHVSWGLVVHGRLLGRKLVATKVQSILQLFDVSSKL